MAQIDSSIYSQQQIPDIIGNVQKGLAMRDLMDQRALQQKKLQEEQGIKEAFRSGMVKNPDGSVSFDNNVVMSNLHQIDPKLSYDFYKKTKEEEAAKLKAKWDQDYKQKELDSKALDRKEARDERRFQAGVKLEEKMQGLKTPYGLANTVDDAKQLKSAHESKLNFDSKIQEMIDLRKKYGTEYWNREAVARGKQLSKDLLLEYKNMAKLGVLSQSDENIINAIIPDDPLGQDYAPGQDPILSNMEKFKSDSDRDFQTRIRTRTRSGIDNAAKDFNQLSDQELFKLYTANGGK